MAQTMAQTAMVRVTALTMEARRSLTSLEREQFPYALAKTLTEVAGIAVKLVQQRTRSQFDLKTDFIPKGIARTKAKKSDVRSRGVGETVIFTKPIISGFMPIHERGGVRRPVSTGGDDKGRALTMPAKGLMRRSYETSRGAIKERYKAKTLLEGYTARRLPANIYSQVIMGKVRRRAGKPFIARGKASGTPMIVRRVTNYPLPLEVLYVFSKRAKYKAGWGFERAVQEAVDLRFESRLRVNLAHAVRTAK